MTVNAPASMSGEKSFPWQLLLVVLVLALIGTVIVTARAGTTQVVATILMEGLIPLVNTAAAIACGMAVVRRLVPEWNRALLIGVGGAIGFGVTSTATLLLGLGGLLSMPTAWGIILVFGALGGVDLALEARRPGSRWKQPVPAEGGLWLLVLPAVATGIAVTAATLPPGGLWGGEPNGYDVTAYHLQLPREWFEAGRIIPLEHNIFSYFPLAAEMQFLLLMHQAGGPYEHMYSPQYQQVMILLLSGVSAAGLVRRWRPTSVLGPVTAGGIVVCLPWSIMLGSIAYNEVFLLLATLACVAGTVEAVNSPSAARCALLAGMAAGIGLATKYTAVPMLVLPAMVLFAAAYWKHPRRLAIVITMFIAGALLFSLPWLLRNVGWAGNPVYPLATGIFGEIEGRPEALAERWKDAHAPVRDPATMLSRLGSEVLVSPMYGWVGAGLTLFASVLVIGRDSGVRRVAGLLTGWIGAMIVIWLVATHLQGRFLYLAVGPAAVLVGLAAVGTGRWVLSGLAAALMVTGPVTTLLRLLENPSVAASRTAPDMLFGAPTLLWATPFISEEQADGREVYLVGEARAYSFEAGKVRYRSVFDVPPGTGAVQAWLSDALESAPADAWVVIDPSEVQRLSATYGTPRLEIPVSARPDGRALLTMRQVRNHLGVGTDGGS